MKSSYKRDCAFSVFMSLSLSLSLRSSRKVSRERFIFERKEIKRRVSFLFRAKKKRFYASKLDENSLIASLTDSIYFANFNASNLNIAQPKQDRPRAIDRLLLL